MSNLPAHASPSLAPLRGSLVPREDDGVAPPQHGVPSALTLTAESPPPSLLSPAFTPPSTPGTGTPANERAAKSHPIDTSRSTPAPRLLQDLPTVSCVVRARIPTTTGQEMFLHLYQNSLDNKEHLAIVFGSKIRSTSLDEVRPGETEMDRMIRGAYTGRLFPGRMHSGFETAESEHLDETQVGNQNAPRPEALRNLVSGIAQPDAGAPATTSRTRPAANAPATPSLAQQPKQAPSAPLVRIHSECYTGETVWSARCDCGEQLDEAARLMSLPSPTLHAISMPALPLQTPSPAAEAPGGVIIYLRQEGRGIGLSEKLKAYNLQDLGNDTVDANLLLRHPADARSYGLATAMLVDLGLGRDGEWGAEGVRLLTNNPEKVRAIEGPGREVLVRERVEMVPLAWRSGGMQGIRSKEVEGYLQTKIKKMNHLLDLK